jgi:hypothetical protein
MQKLILENAAAVEFVEKEKLEVNKYFLKR